MSYDISALSEFLVDGKLNIFESAYKDLRFNVRMARYVTVDSAWEANLPGLSYAVYGTTDLWRVLLYANGLRDPLNDVAVGVRLGIPDLNSVASYLMRSRNTTPTVVI